MANCCGEYHYADCPIVRDSRLDIPEWDELDMADEYAEFDSPEPEMVDPKDCDHGDTNGEEINGETIMVCVHCEAHTMRVIPCGNEECHYGKVYGDEINFLGHPIPHDCPEGCIMGSHYETI